MSHLPIDSLRHDVVHALEGGPVVLCSPPGSGKSTRVPRWCPGPVLVVEPRRVACRSLAQWVAEAEGTALGDEVGYQVRDEHRAASSTRILFATPGMVLAAFDAFQQRFATVILDEFHERRMDVDLLMGLWLRRPPRHLLVMSATVDADALAAHLGGTALRVQGRAHPVEVRHRSQGELLPTARDLAPRVCDALAEVDDVPGDRLVFLPGKGEIAEVGDALANVDAEVVPLHGDLSLEQQGRAFRAAGRRKIILATNVAETSVTVPGVRVVIDAGLARRTRYQRGRGVLALQPIAQDSADQRAGRAGRTGPGVCIRLWDAAAKLEPRTPPEVHRESLVPFVLGAAALGERAEALPVPDPPPSHALEAARGELEALGALQPDGTLTDMGRRIFGLPIDAHLGRLLVEARRSGPLDDAIDLVAALSVGRPLFVGRPPADEDLDLRACGDDAVALVRAVREGDPAAHRLSVTVLREARAHARRLRRAFERPAPPDAPVDAQALVRTALAADPRCAHVARTRRGRTAYSNGGTEIELDAGSALHRREQVPSALVVLDTRALGKGSRDSRVVATAAMPVPLSVLHEMGLGRERVAQVHLSGGAAVARIERVYAKRVLGEREEEPTGALAREAIATLFLRGSLFRDALETTRDRLSARALAARLREGTLDVGVELPDVEPPPSVEQWVRQRLESLGVERGSDVTLLSPEDLTAEDLPAEVRGVLDKELPRQIHLGDARYAVDYDLRRRQVVLRMVAGKRDRPPPASFLPPFRGFRVCVEAGGAMHVVRER